ncbi:YihY/virulence factor BrkB family protein [Anaerotalea alkaliphila]|uniref:YihY/virulence factor BrkB family protein n=1 Tax=Anaerotalea alkaliphila TaxID=2662126 RepID=A0A7X5HX91_9FIRM|nr:YihY/virulence factor BrkB family protein [Anaerotalea alkaliphila]NDL68320.1 YihY/virulence factor BrkB family protein [Anaerotalea alkaliphila]
MWKSSRQKMTQKALRFLHRFPRGHRLVVLGMAMRRRIREDAVTAWASKLTLYLLLSIFPFLIFLMELLKVTALQDPLITQELLGIFPMEVVAFVQYVLEDLQTSIRSSGGVLSVSILASLWAASRGIMVLVDCLNRTYRSVESRSYLFLRLLSLVYTLALVLLLLVVFTLVIFGNNLTQFILGHVSLPVKFEVLFGSLRFLVTLLFFWLFFLLLYATTPYRKAPLREVLPGAVFSTLGWFGASFAFSYYIRYSTTISYMYGSLGGLVLLMVWLYISSVTIIVGGTLNAAILEEKKEST